MFMLLCDACDCCRVMRSTFLHRGLDSELHCRPAFPHNARVLPALLPVHNNVHVAAGDRRHSRWQHQQAGGEASCAQQQLVWDLVLVQLGHIMIVNLSYSSFPAGQPRAEGT